MGRRWLLVAAPLLVVAAGIALMLTTQRHSTPTEASPFEGEVRGAAALARQACTSVALAVIDIERNAGSKRVFSRLQRAQRDGHAAATSDPRWTRLDSGVQALLTSVRRDDPQLADLGLRVVREVCGDAGVPV